MTGYTPTGLSMTMNFKFKVGRAAGGRLDRQSDRDRREHSGHQLKWNHHDQLLLVDNVSC